MIRTQIAARATRAGGHVALAALAALALSMVVAGPARAASLKIGVVNVSTLLQEAPQSQKMSDELKTEFAPRQRKLLNMQQALKKKQDQYKRDSSIMGDTERQKLEQQIVDGQKDLQRADTEFRQDLNDKRNEALGNLQRALLQEVQSYARNKGYDLVVSDVLYYSDAVDITKDVLAQLKKESGAKDK